MDSITIAKFLTVPTAFLASGYSIAFSQNAVPLIYDQAASISTKVFKGVFYQGGAFVVPCALISLAGSSYLAYKLPEQRHLWIAAGAITIAPPVFTQLVMKGGINRLLEIGESVVEQQKADQSGEVTRLLKAWVMLNAVRATLSFAGGALALLASWEKL